MAHSCDAIIIGAGPAGLATAATLQARGLNAAILEKSDAVGAVWRRHYDRLHLHTDRARSALPCLVIPNSYGRYPSRAHVVEYLEAYAAKFDLKPVFNAAVRAVRREGPGWRAEAGENSQTAPIVVVATGWADYPYKPTWPGMEAFGGPIMHSSHYRNPAPFAEKRVLVVGYGNSGAEIALDLAEAGIDVSLSVRSPVNIVPRELFGLPILFFPAAEQWLPARLADSLNAPFVQFAIGSIEKLGFKRSPKGPIQAIEEDGRVPLIDVGTLDAIRDGRIELRGDVASFARESVVFKQSPAERFEAIILATGFRPDLRGLLPDAKGVLNATGAPLVSGRATTEPGLFFCGAIPSALGQFRQIGIEAQRIADVAQKLRAAQGAVSLAQDFLDPGRNSLARRPQSLLVEQVRVVGRLEVDLATAQAVGARLRDKPRRRIDGAGGADGDE